MARVVQPFVPYRQGEFDGLCGMYAIINAISALAPELDQATARTLFRHLARHVQSIEQPLPVVAYGMGGSSVRDLLRVAQRYVRKRLNVQIAMERPFRLRRDSRLGQLWDTLRSELDAEQVAIFAIEGVYAHWTVAYRLTPKRIRLLDSGHRQMLLRSRCTLRPTEVRFRIVPREIMLLRRCETEW